MGSNWCNFAELRLLILISGQCLTIKGIPCKFPFKYKDKSYNFCAKSLLGNFCATEVDRDSKLKDYGKCGEDCPTTDTGRYHFYEGIYLNYFN